MLKKYKGTIILTSVITLIPIIVGMILWNKLPAEIATHFDINNNPDGYSSKAFAVFGIPLIILALHILSVVITPLKNNEKNIPDEMMYIVLWICPVLSNLLSAMTYSYSLGNEVEIGFIITMFLGIVFIAIGNYLPKCKQNSVVGFRTKATLQDAEAWSKVNRFSGKVIFAGGIAICLTSILQSFIILLLIVAVMMGSTLIYSLRFKK